MTAIDQEAERKVQRARSALILDNPFFGQLALRLTLREMPGIPTLCTDGRFMGYNPKFIRSIPIEQVKAECAHEVMHCVLNHVGRRGGRDPKKWNYACDYAINPDLKEAGFKLGDDWLLDMRYKGMTADHIYNLIPDPPPDENGPSDIVDGQSDPDFKPLTKEEETGWKLAAAQAAQAAQKAGKLSAMMEQFVDELLRPKVDWRAILRQFVQESAKADYSWTRPNRMYAGHGLYLPSLYSEAMGRIVIMKDVSGSIDRAVSSAFSSEVKGIKEDMQPEGIDILYIDTEIKKHSYFSRDDNFTALDNMICGGTDFCPGFDWIAEHDIKPTCVVYLTDLEGPFPKFEPEYPVLWCTINDLVAPWGQTVRIEV